VGLPFDVGELVGVESAVDGVDASVADVEGDQLLLAKNSRT
jgi:hypothetical protein